MSDIRNYDSKMNDPSSRRLGTFSYLPRMDAKRIRKQVAYIVSKGWAPAIEHVEPERSMETYWYMWKLPMFALSDVDAILAEAEACREANPDHHVRLIGYDSARQTLGASMVVHRAKGF